MRGNIARFGLTLALGLLAASPVPSAERSAEAAAPFRMVRSLQNIQDSVINGDLNAVEMQRFLLGEIDRRLRTAEMLVFEDPRNVDAALIYAMSGGNPETLDILADRDVAGRFDNRVTSILRRYLSGKGGTAVKQLQEVVPEYRNTPIGPYLELIGANALMEKDPEAALRFFDWARVEAPGSIVEEAALRRSLNITSHKGDTARALPFARRYARRYMASPYASQFADTFVSLALDHQEALPPEEISSVLSLVEGKRQREIYLRLARRAAINGNRTLTEFASAEARKLSTKEDTSQLALAELYTGIVNISGDGVNEILNRLAEIPDQELTPKDRFLRDAARVVAEEVTEVPGGDSLTQVKRDMVDKEYRDRMSELSLDAGKTASTARVNAAADGQNDQQDAQQETRRQALDLRIEKVENFVSSSRSRLRDVDALLSGESN
ncbi:chemotaxis protein [Rhizobium sp. KVB221]|uniref:Chemotaxis protein n=1 Tax=Rhizobium setariae TaxID=2801340 RepID=A0A937CM99_9HYPH|nr:chemotaxis protein MotC [Rhizobium setariae]MBL0370689.1 chemotaxis protein [Rhizobium setariae]